MRDKKKSFAEEIVEAIIFGSVTGVALGLIVVIAIIATNIF